MNRVPYWQIHPDRLPEFLARSYQERYFFPHRIHFLPKAGPDHAFLSRRMCGITTPNKFWEVLLVAERPAVDEFPAELFFDTDLVWHRQQTRQAGHIAFATVAISGKRLYALNYVADVVQRISRRREYKTRLETIFKGWSRMLINGIMSFAHERGLRTVYSPTAALVMANADPTRTVQPELFERVYDNTLNEHFSAETTDKWWVVDVQRNKHRIVRPERKQIELGGEKTICIFHDIERGLGHRGIDSKLATFADANTPAALAAMLRTEKQFGIKATYNVVGSFFNEVRRDIEADGHCLAFHSYDHKIDQCWPLSKVISRRDQLDKLRDVDYHVRGFRPAQSKHTLEISDRRLCRYNFNWLASAAEKLHTRSPKLQNRLVKIPILLDDFPLYKKNMPFAQWEKLAIDLMEENEFVALGLHDCYAHLWQSHYESFLDKVTRYGVLKTFDHVADEIFLSQGV